MHLLRSPALLRGFRIASLLICLKFLLLAVATAVLVHAVILIDWRRALIAFGFTAAGVFVGIGRAVFVGFIRCPLCMTAVFSPYVGNHHPKARSLLGSYHLRVALSIIFRKTFTCPYCNEPTAMKLRPHR